MRFSSLFPIFYSIMEKVIVMFTNNKILILGFARSGYEAAKLLIQRGNEVILNDGKDESKQNAEQVKELTDLGVKFIFGSHPDDLLDESFDYLVKNPGVPIDHKYVLKARELGIEVLNEVEVAYRLLPKDVTLIGITGTNGKTTTTTLIYEMIKKSGKSVHLAGNIGYPLCSFLPKLKKDDIIVMEVSCQQLNDVKEFHPHIAVMTNLSPAHIDFLKSYENYKNVKTKLFQNQTSADFAILNYDNQDVQMQTQNILSTKEYFSSKTTDTNIYLKDQSIYLDGEEFVKTSDIFLKGTHNYENIMAAILAVRKVGVPKEDIIQVLKTFRGVEHRLEFVRDYHGITFYNDTEATNIKCTQIALQTFKEPTIIFLGGMERGQDFNELTPYMDHVKAILAIGTCRNRVQDYGNKLNIPTYSYEYLKDAFPKAMEIAASGDIVLLSPASASWDQYKECEVRGAEFKKYVEELNDED